MTTGGEASLRVLLKEAYGTAYDLKRMSIRYGWWRTCWFLYYPNRISAVRCAIWCFGEANIWWAFSVRISDAIFGEYFVGDIFGVVPPRRWVPAQLFESLPRVKWFTFSWVISAKCSGLQLSSFYGYWILCGLFRDWRKNGCAQTTTCLLLFTDYLGVLSCSSGSVKIVQTCLCLLAGWRSGTVIGAFALNVSGWSGLYVLTIYITLLLGCVPRSLRRSPHMAYTQLGHGRAG